MLPTSFRKFFSVIKTYIGFSFPFVRVLSVLCSLAVDGLHQGRLQRLAHVLVLLADPRGPGGSASRGSLRQGQGDGAAEVVLVLREVDYRPLGRRRVHDDRRGRCRSHGLLAPRRAPLHRLTRRCPLWNSYRFKY